MSTDYKWLFCESDLAGIMLLALELREVHSKELLRVYSGYDRVKRKAEMLVDEGLLEKHDIDKPHPATIYALTPKGQEIAKLLKKIKNLLEEDGSQRTLDEDYRMHR